MRLTHLTLCNFRCFGPEPVTIDLHPNEPTAFIGTNGAGKTAVLQALNRLFGTKAADRRFCREDFHWHPAQDTDPKELVLWLEARFAFPAGSTDDTSSAGVPEQFSHMMLNGPNEELYCRVRLEATWQKTSQAEGAIEDHIYWVINSEADQQKADKLPEIDRQVMPAYERSRIETIYVPASRDPVGPLRHAAMALLAPLLANVEWSDERKENALKLARQLGEVLRQTDGVRVIEEALRPAWRRLQQFPLLQDVHLQPFDDTFESLVRHVVAMFGENESSTHHAADRLSDGLRSLFYFAALDTRFKLEKEIREGRHLGAFRSQRAHWPLLTIFAVEEPENHLAPHYLGRVVRLLRDLSAYSATQVVLTSQSPAIMARMEPEAVRYVHIPAKATCSEVRKLALPDKQDELFKYVKEAVRAHPELYFAQVVVLGEGDTEALVLPRLARAKGVEFDHLRISFVPLGGRHVHHFWRLLTGLNIAHATLLDLDCERHGGGWGRVGYAIEQLREYRGAEKLGFTEAECTGLAGLPRDKFDNLHAYWLPKLEEQGVFFSAPLDLDFVMLRRYPDLYQLPRLRSKGPSATDTKEAKAALIKQVLKGGQSGIGTSYCIEEQEAFRWYDYHFLRQGKPVSHHTALSRLADDTDLLPGMPPVVDALFGHILTLVKPPVAVTEEEMDADLPF